jgi:hypothetical protein
LSIEHTQSVTAGIPSEAPSEHVVELLGAEIVGCSGMGEAVLAGVASVAVKDDPDMARNRV